MPVLIQISLGSIVLVMCSAIHIWTVGQLVVLQAAKAFTSTDRNFAHNLAASA